MIPANNNRRRAGHQTVLLEILADPFSQWPCWIYRFGGSAGNLVFNGVKDMTRALFMVAALFVFVTSIRADQLVVSSVHNYE